MHFWMSFCVWDDLKFLWIEWQDSLTHTIQERNEKLQSTEIETTSWFLFGFWWFLAFRFRCSDTSFNNKCPWSGSKQKINVNSHCFAWNSPRKWGNPVPCCYSFFIEREGSEDGRGMWNHFQSIGMCLRLGFMLYGRSFWDYARWFLTKGFPRIYCDPWISLLTW